MTRLEAALETYREFRAEPFAERCEHELAACGRTSDGRSRDRVELTPQESAVARLVTAGQTNREVARELVLSVKTIEYHLRNIYTKLGIDSRTKLAVLYARRDQET